MAPERALLSEHSALLAAPNSSVNGLIHADGMPLDSTLRLSARVAIPAKELVWRFSRSSGPGGQSVNTTDSRVELVFPLATTPSLPAPLRHQALQRLTGQLVDGAVVIAVSEHRSQWRNRQAAQSRLIQLLRQAIAPSPPPRRPTKPTRGSVARRLRGKKRRSGIKERRRERPSIED